MGVSEMKAIENFIRAMVASVDPAAKPESASPEQPQTVAPITAADPGPETTMPNAAADPEDEAAAPEAELKKRDQRFEMRFEFNGGGSPKGVVRGNNPPKDHSGGIFDYALEARFRAGYRVLGSRMNGVRINFAGLNLEVPTINHHKVNFPEYLIAHTISDSTAGVGIAYMFGFDGAVGVRSQYIGPEYDVAFEFGLNCIVGARWLNGIAIEDGSSASGWVGRFDLEATAGFKFELETLTNYETVTFGIYAYVRVSPDIPGFTEVLLDAANPQSMVSPGGDDVSNVNGGVGCAVEF